ncbi:hypothetical protein L0Y65_00085 [Candidatus Micrarchaeota archaeon]|nr:hypothetical protein [Candidatus Micrarchaeota archaeon]
MIKAVFDFSVIAALSCIAGFIILSIAGSILEKRLKGEANAKAERMFKTLAFALFLILGFSMVPIMVGLFIPALGQVVPIRIDFLEQNDMLIVYAAWAVYAIGLAIAWPEAKKEFFGAGKNDGPPPMRPQAPSAGSTNPPGFARPPLDRRIGDAGAIVLAMTEKKDDEAASYTVLEVWKAPAKGFPLKKDGAINASTKSFERQGYEPLNRQMAVFFFSGKAPYDEIVELLPVIGSYVMYAPSDTTVQEYLGLEDLKKRVLPPTA